MSEITKDTWKLGEHEFSSRFILGSGKYSLELIDAAVKEAKAEIVTMALRRANEGGVANILDYIPKNVTLLPNTSGARNAEEAVRIARLSRQISGSDFVKIEVIHDSKYLLPDNYETAKAVEVLAKEGFVVMPYMYPDLNAARDMQNAGAACIMPLAAPIGSNRGVCTKDFIQILIDEIDLPIIVSYYKNKKRDERAKKLMIEFRDAIQAVAAALLAGYSIEHAWKEAEREIMDLYGKEAMITKELIQMNAEIKLNRNVEEILHDLAVRSGVEEIQSFAEIFGFAKRSGGDFPQIIRTTAARISAKIEVEREVDTVIAGKKLEGKIMSVMPFFILAYLNLASGEFIDPLYGNLAGVLVMSAALLVFVGAMAINRRISDIRV